MPRPQLQITIPQQFNDDMKKFMATVQRFQTHAQTIHQTFQHFPFQRAQVTQSQISIKLRHVGQLFKKLSTAFMQNMDRIINSMGRFGKLFMKGLSGAIKVLGWVLTGVGVVISGGLATFGIGKWIWDKMVGLGDSMLQDWLIASGTISTVGGIRAFRTAFGTLPDDPALLHNIMQGRINIVTQQYRVLQFLGVKRQQDTASMMVAASLAAARFMKRQPRPLALRAAQMVGLTAIFSPKTLLALMEMSEKELEERAKLFERQKEMFEISDKAVEGWKNFRIQIWAMWAKIGTIIGEKLSDEKSDFVKAFTELSKAIVKFVQAILDVALTKDVVDGIEFYSKKLTDWMISDGPEIQIKKTVSEIKETIKAIKLAKNVISDFGKVFGFSPPPAPKEREESTTQGVKPAPSSRAPDTTTPRTRFPVTVSPIIPPPVVPPTRTTPPPPTSTTPTPAKPSTQPPTKPPTTPPPTQTTPPPATRQQPQPQPQTRPQAPAPTPTPAPAPIPYPRARPSNQPVPTPNPKIPVPRARPSDAPLPPRIPLPPTRPERPVQPTVTRAPPGPAYPRGPVTRGPELPPATRGVDIYPPVTTAGIPGMRGTPAGASVRRPDVPQPPVITAGVPGMVGTPSGPAAYGGPIPGGRPIPVTRGQPLESLTERYEPYTGAPYATPVEPGPPIPGGRPIPVTRDGPLPPITRHYDTYTGAPYATPVEPEPPTPVGPRVPVTRQALPRVTVPSPAHTTRWPAGVPKPTAVPTNTNPSSAPSDRPLPSYRPGYDRFLGPSVKPQYTTAPTGVIPGTVAKPGPMRGSGGMSNADRNWDRYLNRLAYLESDYNTKLNSKGNKGAFQISDDVVRRKEYKDIKNPQLVQTGTYAEQKAKVKEMIRARNPDAAAAIERGDKAAADHVLGHQWGSLPTSYQSKNNKQSPEKVKQADDVYDGKGRKAPDATGSGTGGPPVTEGALLAPNGKPPKAVILHYTEGSQDVRSTVNTFASRSRSGRLGSQYMTEKDGTVKDVKQSTGYTGTTHISEKDTPQYLKDLGISNDEVVGIEIASPPTTRSGGKEIGTDPGRAAIDGTKAFVQKYYPNTPVLSHHEANPGHRTPPSPGYLGEGQLVAEEIRRDRGQNPKDALRPLQDPTLPQPPPVEILKVKPTRDPLVNHGVLDPHVTKYDPNARDYKTDRSVVPIKPGDPRQPDLSGFLDKEPMDPENIPKVAPKSNVSVNDPKSNVPSSDPKSNVKRGAAGSYRFAEEGEGKAFTGGKSHLTKGTGTYGPEGLNDTITYAGQQAGVETVIQSGMEPGHSRHTKDEPAYDVILKDASDGHILRSDVPADRAKMEKYIESAARTPMGSGIGHGKDGAYMGVSGIHVGGGPPSVWGERGKGVNAPDWVRKAWERGRKAGLTPEQIKKEITEYKKKQAAEQKPAEDKSAFKKRPEGEDATLSEQSSGKYKSIKVKPVKADNRTDHDLLFDSRPLSHHDSSPSPSDATGGGLMESPA